MNKYIKIQATIAILITFSVATGCATTGKDLVYDDTVKIERISSERGAVTFVSAVQEGDEVVLRGEVRRRSISRGPIPGHVDVEVLDSSGATLDQMSVDYRRLSVNARQANFQTRLAAVPSSGGLVRVIHHDTQLHDPM